jgi:hypothetical protein
MIEGGEGVSEWGEGKAGKGGLCGIEAGRKMGGAYPLGVKMRARLAEKVSLGGARDAEWILMLFG